MDAKIKELNQLMNDYIVKNELEDNIFFEYLEIIYKLNMNLVTILKERFEAIENDYDLTNSSFISINEKINLLKDFYLKNQIDIDIDILIQNGIIDFIERNSGEIPFKLHGLCQRISGKDKIDVSNNGVIIDIPIISHELGHFRTLKMTSLNELNYFFTETIARLDQLQIIDYLKDLGYEKEMEYSKKRIYQNAYNIAKYSEPLFNLLLLYKKLGNLSSSNYQMYYKNVDNYEEKINKAYNRIKKYKYFLDKLAPYIIDTYLSSYLYIKCKENNNYKNNINEFIESFSQNDINKSLKIIGLTNLGKEDQDILLNAVKEMINSITKEEIVTRTK